jgi:uncharacterized protein YcfJ
MKASFVRTGSILVIACSLTACGPGNENMSIGTAAGTAVGAGAGAVIGHQTGHAAGGAVIGGAAGAVTGAAIGATRDAAEKKTTEEDEFIKRQKRVMDAQQREVEDLRRQKYHDDYYRSRYLRTPQDEPPPQEDFGGY